MAAINRLPIDPIWITKDGRKIPISTMDTAHLKSSLRLIRKHKWRRHMVPWINAALRERRERQALFGLENSIHTDKPPRRF